MRHRLKTTKLQRRPAHRKALLSNLMNSATFFSSTTLLALGGLMALFGSVEKSAEIIESLPFAQRTSQALLEAKVISLILLFVYSLINRWYILDLRRGQSMVEALSNSGLDVFCFDWGEPRDEDRYLDWDTVLGRLGRTVRRVLSGRTRWPPPLPFP